MSGDRGPAGRSFPRRAAAAGALVISQRLPAAVDTVVAWALREGWNPGRADAACFAAADPTGFFLGEVAGTPAATVSLVKYGDDFAFLGLYIVAPELRGRGHGLAIWRAALAAAAGRNIGLDGVVAQQDNYRREGFRLAYRNIRFGGVAPAGSDDGRFATTAAARSATRAGLGRARGADGKPADLQVVLAGGLPLATLDAYDASCFPARRTAFLRAWLAMPEARALAALREGTFAGYGVIRPAHTGWKIGPLFADDAAAADALFRGLVGIAPGAAIFLDVPEPNAAALGLAQRYGMTPVFETARMYTGAAPDVPLARVYGVTTFELG